MRILLLLWCILLIGCGQQPTGNLSPKADSPDAPARKHGSDWPAFLGPLGTGGSPEKGIIAPWPREGLRIMWKKQVGGGYGMPVVSQGRLFQFDRQGDEACLSCLRSETGKLLWTFKYPTRYEDYYGYNN